MRHANSTSPSGQDSPSIQNDGAVGNQSGDDIQTLTPTAPSRDRAVPGTSFPRHRSQPTLERQTGLNDAAGRPAVTNVVGVYRVRHGPARHV